MDSRASFLPHTMATLIASTALTFQNPNHKFLLRNPNLFSPLTKPFPRLRLSASLSLQNPKTPANPNPNPLLSTSTKTLTSLFALASLLLRRVVPSTLSIQTLALTSTNLFFAAIRRPPPPEYINTPLTVVAAGMSKWLDIYSGVLMVRVLLSWFPNIPWDRQPLSAIRDLCDPYLNLFRNIIPPVFDTLDVSPLLAFAVLGTFGSLLRSSASPM